MLKLDITKEVMKFLGRLPAKQYRQFLNKILALLGDPEPPDAASLTGYPYRRTDVGESIGLSMGLKRTG